MPVEIREIVLRARVVEDELPEFVEQGDDQEADRLKSEILTQCARMIRDELSRAKSR